jgi:hypothetical protein
MGKAALLSYNNNHRTMQFNKTSKTTEKIQLQHPQGKKMPNIDQEKYLVMKNAILDILKNQSLTHKDLHTALLKKLKGKFEGDIGWYMEGVKLDLEARGIVSRSSSNPQVYKLSQ